MASWEHESPMSRPEQEINSGVSAVEQIEVRYALDEYEFVLKKCEQMAEIRKIVTQIGRKKTAGTEMRLGIKVVTTHLLCA